MNTVISSTHLGPPVKLKAQWSYNTLSWRLKGSKWSYVQFRPKVLPIKAQAKLPETFVEPVLLYDSFNIVYGNLHDKKLRNTALRMMLGLYNRRQMNVQVVVEKFLWETSSHNYGSVGLTPGQVRTKRRCNYQTGIEFLITEIRKL